MLDLLPLFDELAPVLDASGTVRFTAHPLANLEGYRVAKDVEGAPAVLITTGPAGAGRANPVSIEHLVVQHDVVCRIAGPDGGVEEGNFSLVRCRGQERTLHVYFLRTASALIATLGSAPSQDEVTRGVNKLVELFRVMSDPSRKSVQGLWAELFVIARAKDPSTLIRAWHATPGELYDFGQSEQCIEVKSTASRTRQHHFLMDQVNPPLGTTVVVVSVLVSRAASGISVADLVDTIRSRLGSDFELILRVDSVVAHTLGENWRAGMDERFDLGIAVDSLAYFDARLVPAVRSELPPEVSSVSFTSDLSHTQPIDSKQLRRMGELFLALLR